MKIPVTLNEMPFTFDTTPSEKLVSALRREKILSVKNSCNTKTCGGCYILLDDKVIASCHIPVGLVKNSKIITLEHFSKTEFLHTKLKKIDFSNCNIQDIGVIANDVCGMIVSPEQALMLVSLLGIVIKDEQRSKINFDYLISR